jgi:hypothetical protein
MNRKRRCVPGAVLLLLPGVLILFATSPSLRAQEPAAAPSPSPASESPEPPWLRFPPNPVPSPVARPAPSPAAVAEPSPAPAAHPATSAVTVPGPSPAASAPGRTGRSLGPDFDGDLLRGLPMSNGLWSLFETIESTAILDRMEGSGLYVGEAGLLGIRGSSWTQASWRLGDLDITDPDRTGTPLFFASPEALEAVQISAGVRPADEKGGGPGVSLAVRRPGSAAWHKTVQVSQIPSALQQSFNRAGAPAIAHVNSYASGAFSVDGPLIKDKVALLVTGNVVRGSRRERSDPRPLDGSETGLLAHAVYARSARDEIRFLGGLQALSHPYAGRARFGGGDVAQSDHLLMAQSTWQRQAARPWSVTAGVVRGSFDPQLPLLATGSVERLGDGPVQQQFPGDSTRGRWALSGWMDPLSTSHHAVRVGGSMARTYSTTKPTGPIGLTPEKVGGLPARVWEYGWAGPASRWSGFDVSAFASDEFRYRRLSLDAGLRFESSRASAAGAAHGIQWTALSPRLLARFVPVADDPLTLVAGWAWYRNRLPLNLLAYGDPSGPQGNVYRWDDANDDRLFQPSERGPLVARVGPGGNVASIDADLIAPQSREVFVGFETSAGTWKARMLGYFRRERSMVTSVNFGAALSAYDVSYIDDPGDDIADTGDDHLLPVYNRRPDTFGQDQYLLTNDPEKGTGKGLEIGIDGRIGNHLRLLIGATASKTISPSAYRGFLAIENDQGLVGERLETPNASTLSTGRLFFERGYTVKIAGVYEAPWQLRVGTAVRYQDGQHFARFVIPTGLNQGPEPIKGIYNGDSRFCYVLTIDARIEKGFAVGRNRLAAVFEAFNLRGTGIEVEENVIWGPSYRNTSAVQPPRAIRLGLRYDF